MQGQRKEDWKGLNECIGRIIRETLSRSLRCIIGKLLINMAVNDMADIEKTIVELGRVEMYRHIISFYKRLLETGELNGMKDGRKI